MIDPASAGLMAGGSLLSAGANVAGGLLSQQSFSQGDQTFAAYNPALDPVLAASTFDSLSSIGFSDPGAIPSPSQRIVGQIQALPLDEKTKRRGLRAFMQAMRGDEVTLPRFLESVLQRVGIDANNLDDLRRRDEEFANQQAALSEISGINTDTVMERARASQAAAQLLGGAAQAATGGALTPIQQQIRGRLERNLDDAEEQALLRGQFGGFNPAAALEGFADLRGELDLKAIEQSLLLASGITQTFNQGGSAAQNAAQMNTQANTGALGIAASQAQAANQLQAQVNANNAASLGNGVAGAINAFAQPLTTFGTLGALDSLRNQGSLSPAVANYQPPDSSSLHSGFSITGGPGGSTFRSSFP